MAPLQYLDDLTSALAEALGTTLRAVYLTGSAAVGAYREGSSDIDVLVAVEGAQRASLDQVVAACAHDALPCPAVKLELVVYEVAELTSPHVPPRWSLNFDTGESTRQVDWDPATQPSHWFVLDLAFARRHAKPLLGPPAVDLIAEVDDADVGRAFDELLEWFGRNDPEALPVARA